ncbi:40s ribosomal protein s16 [Globisporangium polare]
MTTAARMRRLRLTLAKALDVSVSQASTASLRAALETHCEDDLALLEQFFPRDEDADELLAHTLLSLRQKIETAFEALCEKYGVNAQLLELEELVQQAEEAKLRAIAREDEEVSEEVEEAASAQAQDSASGSLSSSPDDIVRMERVRIMEDEKRSLQSLLQREKAEIAQLDAAVSDLRHSALQQVERLQSVVRQLDSTRQLATDHANRS